MRFIWFAALLFGFIHPGSKWLMQDGLGALAFCLMYIGLRLIVQVPLVVALKAYKIPSFTNFLILSTFGCAGAGLQFTEFKGISIGLPVPIVTFLVYSHPVWTLLFSRILNKEKIKASGVFKLLLALVGIAFITSVSSVELATHWKQFLWPLSSGFFIALWICLSSMARKRDCSSYCISFYYDLFSFVLLALLAVFTGHSGAFNEALEYMATPVQFLKIFSFSILTALIPNTLFYYGSKQITAFAAGLILLLEPVLSTFFSWLVWKDSLSITFGLGACLILLANCPWADLSGWLRRFRLKGTEIADSPLSGG